MASRSPARPCGPVRPLTRMTDESAGQLCAPPGSQGGVLIARRESLAIDDVGGRREAVDLRDRLRRPNSPEDPVQP